MASDAAENVTSGRRDFRQEVTERMIRALDEGTPPWRKPWFSQGAFNGVTGREYHGGNRLYLRMVAQENGWDDPRWYTFNQAKQNEWGVRKGEKGHLVEYWKPPLSQNEARTQAEREKIKHPEIDVEKRAEELEKRGWRVFTAVVFNAAQIDAPVLDADKKPVMQTVVKPSGKEVQKPVMKPLSEVHPWTPASRKIDPIQRAEEIIAGIAPKTKYGADGAFYKSSTDTIHLPNRGTFRSAEEFYSTYLHEIGHWTGHESRLNREGIGAKFGSEAYAKEELRAELASVFLADETGIPLTDYHFQQHAAYIKSWAKELRENKHEIFAAARDAERIAEYVMAAAEERAALRDADLAEEASVIEMEAQPLQQAVNAREMPENEESVNRRDLPGESVNFHGLPGNGNGVSDVGWHHHTNGGGRVHDSANVAASAFVAQSASVGPNAIVEEHARIGKGSVVLDAAHIEDRAIIADEVIVGKRVIIGHASEIGAQTTVREGAMIGKMVRIDEESLISDNAVVMSGARIGLGVDILANSVVGDSAVVRYQSKLGEHVRIGNGVSIGNGVRIGDFTEVGHAASIGDYALIGERMFIAPGGRVQAKAVLQRADDSASHRSFPLGDDGWMNMRALPRALNDGSSTPLVTAFESANQSFIVERGNGEQAYGFMQVLRAQNALDDWRFYALQDVVLQRGGAFTAFQVARDFPEIADIPSLQRHAFEVLEALDGSKGIVMGAFVFASLPSSDVSSLRRLIGERAADANVVRAFDRFVETHRNGTPHVLGTNARLLPEPEKIALAAYHEAMVPGADITASQAIIEQHGNGETAYRFARDIAGADIAAMLRVVTERGSALDAVKFMRDVPSVDEEMAQRLEDYVAFKDAAIDTGLLAEFNRARAERSQGVNARALPSAEVHDFGSGVVPAHRHINGGGWVAETAFVADSAFVGPDAKVYGNAAVFDHARVVDQATVRDNAVIAGSAQVREQAVVGASALVSDYATISGHAQVYGRSVFANATIGGDAVIHDRASVFGSALVLGGVRLGENALVSGGFIGGSTVLEGEAVAEDGDFIAGGSYSSRADILAASQLREAVFTGIEMDVSPINLRETPEQHRDRGAARIAALHAIPRALALGVEAARPKEVDELSRLEYEAFQIKSYGPTPVERVQQHETPDDLLKWEVARLEAARRSVLRYALEDGTVPDIAWGTVLPALTEQNDFLAAQRMLYAEFLSFVTAPEGVNDRDVERAVRSYYVGRGSEIWSGVDETLNRAAESAYAILHDEWIEQGFKVSVAESLAEKATRAALRDLSMDGDYRVPLEDRARGRFVAAVMRASDPADIAFASGVYETVTGARYEYASVNEHRRGFPARETYTAVERADGLYDLYASHIESDGDVRRADRYAYSGTGTREELVAEIERGLDVSILTESGVLRDASDVRAVGEHVNARREPIGGPPVEVVLRGAMYLNAHDLGKWVLTSENSWRTVWDYDPVVRGETGHDASTTHLYAYRNPETQRYSVVGADALAKLGDLIGRFDDGDHIEEQGHPLKGVAWGDLHSLWYNDAAVWESSALDAVTMPLWWSPERQEVWMLPNRNIVQSLAVTVGTYPDAVRVTADLSNGEEQVVRDGVHADMPPPPPRAENINRRAFASQPGLDAASRRADVALNAASPSRYMMPRDVYREWAPIIEGVVERYYRMPQTQESLRMAAREMYDAAMRLPRLSADEAIDLSQDLTNQVLRGGVEEMDDPKGMALHNARRLLSDRADDIVLESARIARTERGVSFAMTLESTWRDVFEQRVDLTYNVSTAMHRVTDQDVADFMDMTDFELGRIKSENLRAATKTVLLKTVAEPSLRGDIDRETALARLDQIAEAVIHYGDTLEATASAEDALAERIGANWRVEPQTETAYEIWYYEDFEGGSGAYIGAHPVQFATAERAAEVAEDLARKSGLAWRFAVTECAKIEDAMERPEPVNARFVREMGDDEINARMSPNGQRFVRPAQADCDAQIESKSRYLYQHKDEIRSALEDAVSWREVESELAHLQVSVKFYASEKAQEQLARGERPHMGYVVVAQVGDREEVCPAYLFGERTSQPQVDKRLGPLTMSPLNLYRAKARSEQSSDATRAAEPKAEQRVNDVATNGAVAGVAKSRNVLPHITIEGGGESSFWQKVGEQFRDGVQRAADEVRDRRSREQILEDALKRFYTEKLPGGAIGYFMSEDALSPVFVDHGKRVDITVSPSQEGLTADERTAIRGAIALAAQKWGEVRITGTDPMFVRASVEIATDLGVEVKNHASLQAQLRAERDNSSTQPSGVSVASEADGVRDAHVSFGDQVREKFGLPPKAQSEAASPQVDTKEMYVVYSPSAFYGAGGFYQYGDNEGFYLYPERASQFDAPRENERIGLTNVKNPGYVGDDARYISMTEAREIVAQRSMSEREIMARVEQHAVNARTSPTKVDVLVHGVREDVTVCGTFIGVRDDVAVLKDEDEKFHGFRETQAFEDVKAGDVLRVQQHDGVVAVDDLVSSNASQHHADVRFYDSAADAAGEL